MLFCVVVQLCGKFFASLFIWWIRASIPVVLLFHKELEMAQRYNPVYGTIFHVTRVWNFYKADSITGALRGASNFTACAMALI